MTIDMVSGFDAVLPPPTPKPTSLDGQLESSIGVAGLLTGEAGLWECDAGTFTGDRTAFAEVCYIISGEAVIRTDGADDERRVVAGSLFVLPRGWRGVWVVEQPIRKVFVLLTDA